MIGRGVIEQAYSFFHQKLRVYEFSHSETQRDDIEYAVSAYVDGMSSELYGVLSGGCPDYLRSHASFEGDIRDAVSRMEEMLCKAAYGLMEYNLGHGAEAFSTMRDAVVPYPVICAHQVHGTRIAVVDRPDLTRDELEGYDALITNIPDCAIGVRTADCIPVLLYDPERRAVAAIHSGWKGTLNRISQKAIFRMKDTYGTNPEDLVAVIGPGICRACFQVGEEVVAYFKSNGINIEPIYSWMGPKQENMKGGHHLDLIEENRILLLESGVPAQNIQVSGICTYEDGRFFSARREGAECGRIINSIKLIG